MSNMPAVCDSTWDKVEEKAKAMKISKKLAEKIVENFFIDMQGFNRPKHS